jgi:hypothetical protein
VATSKATGSNFRFFVHVWLVSDALVGRATPYVTQEQAERGFEAAVEQLPKGYTVQIRDHEANCLTVLRDRPGVRAERKPFQRETCLHRGRGENGSCPSCGRLPGRLPKFNAEDKQ